jgi:hypothetical protein
VARKCQLALIDRMAAAPPALYHAAGRCPDHSVYSDCTAV